METTVHDHGRRLNQREFRPMAEVPFRPARQLSEYKGKGASASREAYYGGGRRRGREGGEGVQERGGRIFFCSYQLIVSIREDKRKKRIFESRLIFESQHVH